MAQQPAAPAVQTGRLRGDAPVKFNGNRSKSEEFMRRWDIHYGLNDNHEIMNNPYLRSMYFLSLIEGPHVDDWVNDQVLDLRDQTTRANNPVLRTDEVLWTELRNKFITAYTDTAKAQQAWQTLQSLRMYKGDLDTYIATFRHLARKAGYDTNTLATINIFVGGLDQGLRRAVLRRDTAPTTFEEWVTMARTERDKHERELGYEARFKYAWTQLERPSTRRNGQHHERSRHPNDQIVPMDVNPPVFTRINRAYTEEDKNRYKKEGRCFRCDKQGHMARDCPTRKEQPFYPKPQYQHPKPQFRKKTFGSKPSGHPKPDQGRNFRKSNKAPIKFGYYPKARGATIEEISEEEYQEEDDVPSLAVRTAQLSDNQKEEWLQELEGKGIHF